MLCNSLNTELDLTANISRLYNYDDDVIDDYDDDVINDDVDVDDGDGGRMMMIIMNK